MRKIVIPILILIVGIGVISATTHSNAPAAPTSAADSPALVTTTTARLTPKPTRHHHPKPKPKRARPQVLKGVGTENIGTIKVPTDSTLRWSCPSCAGVNFIIDNDFNDGDDITVNGLNQTSGKTVIDAGAYHKVQIITEGQAWTLTITPGT